MKSKRTATTLVFLFIMYLGATLQAAIPTIERNALVTVYLQTGGATWAESTGWNGAFGTECQWYGVTCNGEENHVVRLDLANNGLSGSIPPEIGQLTQLERLSLYGNSLGGTIPPEIGQLTQLQTLFLCCQDLGGAIPSEVGNLTNLENFHVHSNQLSGTIPSSIGNLTNLRTLYLWSNQLSGSIPPEIGNLTSLETSYMCCNELSGAIPSEIGNLVNLEDLYLHDNQFAGPLPASIGDLVSLETLRLTNNQLSGELPRQLGNLTSLRVLHLDINRLEGALPPELGQLLSLTNVDLSSNRLTGTLPTSLSSLTNLDTDQLDLRWNGLFTDSDDLRNHLNAVHRGGDFEATQTIAPGNVVAGELTDDHLVVSWTPIRYTDNSGGYRVSYTTDPAGDWTIFGNTADKTASSMVVSGLAAGLDYSFRVQTVTEPHGSNFNTVISDSSPTVTAGNGLWIEIAANNPGKGGSQWLTDVVARNSSAEQASIRFILHTDTGDHELTNTIETGAQGVFEDLVGLMGISGKGALEIRSNTSLMVNARIYNKAANGSFGQFLDAFSPSQGLSTGDTAWLLQLRQMTGEFRSNLSVTNTGASAATVRITLYRTDGAELTTYELTVNAKSVVQDSEPFKNRAAAPDLGWGFARVEVMAGHEVLASASVVDSNTNDATTIAMKRDPQTED